MTSNIRVVRACVCGCRVSRLVSWHVPFLLEVVRVGSALQTGEGGGGLYLLYQMLGRFPLFHFPVTYPTFSVPSENNRVPNRERLGIDPQD